MGQEAGRRRHLVTDLELGLRSSSGRSPSLTCRGSSRSTRSRRRRRRTTPRGCTYAGSRSASPGHPVRSPRPATLHGSGGHLQSNGSSLNRSYSVANMNMNGNIASGGMGGGRDAVELNESADPFKPGNTQAIMHSASVADLRLSAKAHAFEAGGSPPARLRRPSWAGTTWSSTSTEPIQRSSMYCSGRRRVFRCCRRRRETKPRRITRSSASSAGVCAA